MNEYTALQTLRDEVPEPSPAQLAPVFDRLDRVMREAASASAAVSGSVPTPAPTPAPEAAPAPAQPLPAPVPATAHASRRRAGRRIGWGLGTAGGALALALVGGNVAMAAESARTSELLREIAGETVEFADATPASGQYLHSRTRADWGKPVGDESDPTSVEYVSNVQQIDVYMPADPADDWVLVRDWGSEEAVSAEPGSGVHVERLSAPFGDFYGGLGDPDPDAPSMPSPVGGWLGVDPADVPTQSGEAAYEWIDAQHTGGSESRAEDNYERITELLRTGLMPAPQRAALIGALALVPGVTSTADVANLDGARGVAFGRAEALRDGARSEIIVDPETGLVIGERSLAGLSIFGFETGEVVSSTSVETTVVDAPPAE